jgi:predicted GH43/DUF377 family glycosyl hydrolase
MSMRFILVCCFTCLVSNTRSAEPIWEGGWKKSPDNPILSLSPTGQFDSENILAPAIVKHNGRYLLYYCGGPSGPRTGEELVKYQIGLATSNDGVHFKKHGKPLLPLGDRDNFHVTPAIMRDEQGNLQLDDDGTWHMVYAGNRADDVEHATSRDGIAWVKDSQSPIYRTAYAPCILKHGDEVWMYHIHKPAEGNWEVHLATGSDLHSLRPHPENPMLTVSQAWEAQHLVYPYVLRDDDTWVMFYAAYWKSPLGGQKTAIGTATSPDGIHWTKFEKNPILTPTSDSDYDSVYNSSQSVIRDGDVFRLYFAGRVDTIHKYFSIGVATKPTGD